MRNLKIRKKLLVVFGTMIALFIFTVCFSLAGIKYSNDKFKDFYTYSYPISENALEVRTEIQTAMKDICMGLMTDDEQKKNEYLKSSGEEVAKIRDTIRYLKENYRDDISRIEQVEQMLEEARQYRETAQELFKNGEKDASMEIFFSQYEPKMEQVEELVKAMDENTDALAAHTYTQAREAQVFLIVFSLIVSGLVLIVSVSLAGYLTRSLTKPIREIEKAANGMASGSLNVTIDYESKDELGVLAESMRELCRGIREIIEDIDHVLKGLADGDFRVKSKGTEMYVGDYMPILTSMRFIRDNLNHTMLQINQAADQVAGGSEQVSSASQALSQGATEQASSIEELAAAIGEISTQVQDTAKNSLEANSQTAKAGEETEICNREMKEMIEAMQDISRKSTEIGKIIKTIEDIAFQTNILALNAAVEAARAGAAGKGFAVVADEVRNLASKSAEASKNTSGLIEGTIEAVEKGTRIANMTAESLIRVVETTKTAAATVDKISDAANNQATAIEQVMQGIDQISSVVQTNSATAEESAASSEELSGQAQLLKTQVQKFRLLESVS